ncbi:MAG: hypothetical protein ACE5PV_21365 [Candidatus Poribacteria bacterium]
MLAVQGRFDGKSIQFIEPIPEGKPADVIVVFIDSTLNSLKAKKSREARKLLRGCEKGENLLEMLLAYRREEMDK